MTKSALILLLGHENTSEGLSEVAKSRCDAAIKLLHETNGVILPTGAFGRFNKTDKPHAHYLTDYLKSEGVDDNLILPGTDSTNTFEDCLCARKVVLDRGVGAVHVVTSDYHADRVRLILQNVLRDIAVSVHTANTPSECTPKEERKEQKSLSRLKKDWLAPPLYETHVAFPNAVYEAADNAHRHYDSISLAAVTAVVVVTAFPFFSEVNVLDGWGTAVAFWFVALVDLALFAIYERAADTARTARRTLRAIELGFGARGFSANYAPKLVFPGWLPSMRYSVRSLIVLMISASIIAGCYQLF